MATSVSTTCCNRGVIWALLQIKIYRHKFIAYVIFVVAIGLTLGTLTCAMLLNQWVGNARIEAANAFSRVENGCSMMPTASRLTCDECIPIPL